MVADSVLSKQVDIGSALKNSGRTGENVLIEHTSANPNDRSTLDVLEMRYWVTHWFVCTGFMVMMSEQNIMSMIWVNR